MLLCTLRKKKNWQLAKDEELDKDQYDLKELEKLAKQEVAELEDEEEDWENMLVEDKGAKGVFLNFNSTVYSFFIEYK